MRELIRARRRCRRHARVHAGSCRRRSFSQCPRLKVIACALKGFDNFDVAACSEAGMWVTIVPDLLTEPTAELAVGLAIGAGATIRDGDHAGARRHVRRLASGALRHRARRLDRRHRRHGRGRPRDRRRLGGFGCRILGVDPGARDAAPASPRPNSTRALTASDYLILAVPLTPGDVPSDRPRRAQAREAGRAADQCRTRLGGRRIGGRRCARRGLARRLRGGCVRDGGLGAAQIGRERSIRACCAHPRTLFTPHLGSAVERVRLDIAMQVADDIAAVLAGQRPRHAINAPVHRSSGLARQALKL